MLLDFFCVATGKNERLGFGKERKMDPRVWGSCCAGYALGSKTAARGKEKKTEEGRYRDKGGLRQVYRPRGEKWQHKSPVAFFGQQYHHYLVLGCFWGPVHHFHNGMTSIRQTDWRAIL